MPSNERSQHPSMKKGLEGGYQQLGAAAQEEVKSARVSFQRLVSRICHRIGYLRLGLLARALIYF